MTSVQSEIVAKRRMTTKIKLNKELRTIGTAAPFVLPGLILICVFVFYAIFFNIRISFSDYHIVSGKMDFIGLKNFTALFTNPDHKFWYAYRNNFLYAVVTTPVIMFVGLWFAVMINSLNNYRIFFRVTFYLPVITSWVVVGLVFVYLFNQGKYGFFNYLLVDKLHILSNYVPWLAEQWPGNIAIWTMGIWKNIGWSMIIYMAALQGISKEIYEAAAIEGANAINKFFKITLPLLKRTTYFVIVNMTIGAFNVFLQVLLLTKGNPSGKTTVLQYLLYDKTFNLGKYGEGAAIGVLTGLTIFIVTLFMNKLTKSDIE